jgi:hypothetical protein
VSCAKWNARWCLQKTNCNVTYNNKVILRGTKDPYSDLWTLLPNASDDNLHLEGKVGKPHKTPLSSGHPKIATFAHSVQMQANAVEFAHQSLCNPNISTLLKATRHGFLMECPNINKKLILKYLNPSPATAKGHMKRPSHGIQSTTPKTSKNGMAPIPVVSVFLSPVLPLFQQPPPHLGPVYGAVQGPNLIGLDDNEFILNMFCFGAFLVKNNGMVYNDLMGSFPFILLGGRVCFL